MKGKRVLLVLGLISLMVLAACSSSGAGLATQEVGNLESTSTEAIVRVEETPTMQSAVEAEAEPTATQKAEKVEVRAGLEASNPSDFTIASGEVQLVEFFAFW